VFGNGKTAIKGSIGKYLIGASTDFSEANHPSRAIVSSSTRTWNDANGNYVPDCNLVSFGANGECGALDNSRFGQPAPNTFYSPDVLVGWGTRGYSWQGTLSVQHEVRPGLSVSVGYFRTQYGNFMLTNNQLVTAADFNPYCVSAPVDSRLPGGGGNQVCGLYDVSPARFGQVQNLIRAAGPFGSQQERFDGVDVAAYARFAKGAMIQGGVSLGRQITDNCYQNDRPDLTAQGYAAGTPRTSAFCNVSPPWSEGTQYKANGIYPLPWAFDGSFTFQNLPGTYALANQAVPNGAIAPSLGRNLSSCPAAGTCTATATVSLIPPASLFLDRITLLDLRLTKTVRVAGGRVRGMFDIYNLFNANTTLNVNTTYGPTWLRPTAIVGGRLFKFGAQVEF
jgi:hypothetical protein